MQAFIFFFCRLFLEKVMENIYLNVFSIFYTSWNKEMAKFKIRNLKVFKTNIWRFYQNIFQKIGSRLKSPHSQLILDFFHSSAWKMPKRILSWQPDLINWHRLPCVCVQELQLSYFFITMIREWISRLLITIKSVIIVMVMSQRGAE